jgi:hypothetical protein
VDKSQRIDALREKLSAKKVNKKRPYGELFKGFSGPIALIISIISVYFTTFRVVDDVRIIINITPQIDITRYGGNTRGGFLLSVLNAGTRTAIITETDLVVLEAHGPVPAPHCEVHQNHDRSVTRSLDFEPVIIKAGEVSKVVLNNQLEEPSAEDKKDSQEDDTLLPWKDGDLLIACLQFNLATADMGGIKYNMNLKGRAFVGAYTSILSDAGVYGPETIFKHTHGLHPVPKTPS